MSRNAIFFTTTFLITWICWWLLAFFTRAGALQFGQPLFMIPYLLGGFGPTIAAYISIAATRRMGGFKEYHGRLLRVRLGVVWYLLPLLFTFGIGFLSIGLFGLIRRDFYAGVSFQPWYMAFPLFFMMIFGGGLEELGWRGVVLPGFQKRLSAPIAGLLLGAIWAVWHLPLFYIEGVSQYGTSFWIFSIGVLGISLTLTWFYNRTESILICVIYHAAANMVASMGILVPAEQPLGATVEALVKLVVGIVLVLVFPVTARSNRK